MSAGGTRAERSQATRARLVAVARERFSVRGYAAVPQEEIVREASVTRGALYHHFPTGKEDLFRAVYEEVERELTESLGAAALAAPDPWTRLVQGCEAFLDACLDPAVQRITLVDAPAVLGWETWRSIGLAHGLGLIEFALGDAMDAGLIVALPTRTLAHVLLGALDEGAMLMARAEDPIVVRAEVGATLVRLLEGLRTIASEPPPPEETPP